MQNKFLKALQRAWKVGQLGDFIPAKSFGDTFVGPGCPPIVSNSRFVTDTHKTA